MGGLAHLPAHLLDAAQGQREDVKTVQELLRHANSKITLDPYTQALSPAKRQAQSKVQIWKHAGRTKSR